MEPSEDFQILKDIHLTDEADDKFQYSHVASNILSLIEKIDPPFTIGLYGQWGIGKSSICELLIKQIRSNYNEKYEVFYFDTWKYEKDSFRRQFLIELDREVFHEELDYKNKLNQSLTIERTLPFWENFKKTLGENANRLLPRLIIPAFFLVVAVILAIIVSNLILPFTFVEYAELTNKGLALLFSLGFLTYLGKFLLESIKSMEVQITIPRTDSAEGFEYYYQDTLRKIQKEKLVVIIDNLDRLDQEKGVALLSDIKTFLAGEKLYQNTKNKAIFVIPCDDSAIGDQLRAVYKDKIEPEEFLRKFFNVSIRLPKPLDLSLNSFIKNKLQESRVVAFQNNPSLAFVISRAFKNNPREIIQFINTLTANYLLAKRRGLTLIVEKSNLPFFAKVLAIRVKWSEIYKFIEERVIKSSDSIEIAMKGLGHTHTKGRIEVEDDQNFQEFIRTTADIKDEENGEEIYFSLYESQDQRDLPEWRSFISAAEDVRFKDLEKVYILIAESGDKKSAVGTMLSTYFDRFKNQKEQLVNVLKSIQTILSDENLLIFEPFLSKTYYHLSSRSVDLMKADIESLHFHKLLTSAFENLDTQAKKNIAKGLIELFDHISKTEVVPVEHLRSIFEFFTLISTEPKFNFFKTWGAKLLDIKNPITQKFQIPELFPASPIDRDLLKLLLSFLTDSPYVNNKTYSWVLYKLGLLTQQGVVIENPEDLASIIQASKYFLSKVDKPTSLDTEELSRVGSFTSHLIATYNKLVNDLKQRTEIAHVLLKVKFDSNPKIEEVKSTLKDFIRNSATPAKNILGVFHSDELVNFAEEFPDARGAIIEKSRTEPDIIINLKIKDSYFAESDWQAILLSLISSNTSGFIELIKYLKFKLPEATKVNVTREIISRADSIKAEDLEEWLGTIPKIDGQLEGESLAQKLIDLANRDDATKKAVTSFLKKSKSVESAEVLKKILA